MQKNFWEQSSQQPAATLTVAAGQLHFTLSSPTELWPVLSGSYWASRLKAALCKKKKSQWRGWCWPLIFSVMVWSASWSLHWCPRMTVAVIYWYWKVINVVHVSVTSVCVAPKWMLSYWTKECEMALQWPFVNELNPQRNVSGDSVGSNTNATVKKH